MMVDSKSNIKQKADGENFGKLPKPSAPQSDLLSKLISSNEAIIAAASQSIVFSSPWVKLGEVPIISKGTINLIQGKTGAHKSYYYF